LSHQVLDEICELECEKSAVELQCGSAAQQWFDGIEVPRDLGSVLGSR
jgi:hypothetical protein